MLSETNLESSSAVLTVLLVEDNPGDAALFAETFKNGTLPVKMELVTNGEAALDYLFQRGSYAAATNADVVILDINLPRKNGLEVLAEIRKHPCLDGLPVYLASGSRNQEDILRSHPLNVSAFLEKPADVADWEALKTKFFSSYLPQVLSRKSAMPS